MLNPLCQKSETKESQRQIWKVGKSQVRSLNVKYTLLSTRDTTEPLTDITLPSWSSTGPLFSAVASADCQVETAVHWLHRTQGIVSESGREQGTQSHNKTFLCPPACDPEVKHKTLNDALSP